MGVKVETAVINVGNIFKKVTEGTKNILVGNKKAERERIIRIISGNILPEDIERYKNQRVNSYAPMPYTSSLDLTGGQNFTSIFLLGRMVEEVERLNSLTPDQINTEVVQNARQEAKL